MFATSLARLAALSIIAVAGLTATAFAAEQAFTKGPANLREGPGTAYDVIVTLPAGTEVAMEACTPTWCAVTTEDNDEGFIARSLLILADDFMDPEDDEEQYDDEPSVCFYQQANYKGANFCVEEGQSDNDIPGSFDNNIESILITGGLGVEVCSGYNHGGECAYYTESRKSLPNYLRNKITSYAVEEDFNGPDDDSEYIVMQ